MLLKISALLIIFSVFLVAAKAQDFVGSVKASLEKGSVADAEAKLEKYRELRGITPEYIEAYSWLGRNALVRKEYRRAAELADKAYAMGTVALKSRSLDAERRLPIGLGAAIEVKAQAMAAEGERNEAVAYLRSELKKYGSTSIATRLQKNINLLSLEGKPAPALRQERYLGPKPPSLVELRGKPIILFFWAHWCVDCKAQAPILGRLKKEYGEKIALVGPTQLYGYAAEGLPAAPEDEIQYIDYVRKRYFGVLGEVSIPISGENFKEYGASTTPTMVILGGDGRVVRYHPGRMVYEELKKEIDRLIPPKS